jgi:hypothetical protein
VTDSLDALVFVILASKAISDARPQSRFALRTSFFLLRSSARAEFLVPTRHYTN